MVSSGTEKNDRYIKNKRWCLIDEQFMNDCQSKDLKDTVVTVIDQLP